MKDLEDFRVFDTLPYTLDEILIPGVINAATILDRAHCYSRINWTINRGNSISRREKRWNVALRAAPRSKREERRTVWVCQAGG